MLFKNYDELILNGRTPSLQQKRKDILKILSAAVTAVDPYLVVEQHFQGTQLVFESETFDVSTFDHIYVIGFGKASTGMAQAVCDAVHVTKGVVVTNDPSANLSCDHVEVVVGGHPLPNEGSIHGTEKILGLLDGSMENDLVIVLISGGGSSLLCSPRVPLADIRRVTDLLLQSGASIEELNTIRKHLSKVKGGQLIEHTKGIVISLIISDVINNPISSIASGPTSPDPTTFRDAEKILQSYDLWGKIPMTVKTVIQDGIRGIIPETPKNDHPLFRSVFNFVIADNERSCRAAQKQAEDLGYRSTLLTTSMTGVASEVGRFLIRKVKESLSSSTTVFISGGEPTVEIRGTGKGGRNQEFILGSLEELAGTEMVAVSFATDGVDGNSPSAGAVADGFSLERAQEKKLPIFDFLRDNNSYEFFKRLGDFLSTGPTGTNVMDIQIVIR